MRARMKRRQQVRRLTILLTLLIIALSLGVGIYFVSTSGRATALDSYINLPVTSSDVAALQKLSFQPYGPAGTDAMQSAVQKYGGTPFISNGKPVLVFVGGEFCQYCAVERWAIIIALERFGNFTNLHYMTSTANEGDYATFTFVGSHYTSGYVAFRPYEASDRSGGALQGVPSNYTAVWSHFGSGFPFLDFGNTYVTAGSLIADPGILQGKNWTSVITGVATSTGAGLQIREAANLITAVICKLTQGAPDGVCRASPISSQTASLAGPAQGGLALGSATSAPSATQAPPRASESHRLK